METRADVRRRGEVRNLDERFPIVSSISYTIEVARKLTSVGYLRAPRIEIGLYEG